jgi:hypothetical protein
LGNTQRTVGERFVEAQILSDDNHSGMDCGAEVGHKLTDKSVQFVHVNRGNGGSAHVVSPFS